MIPSSSQPRPSGAVAVVASLVLVALLGACGGTEPPSPADYRRDVNAICRSTRTAIAHLPKANTADPAALVKSGQRALAIERNAARKIAGLTPPARDERAVRHWLDLVGRALDSVEVSLRAQRAGDLAAASRANTEGTGLVTQADQAAGALEFGDCATPAVR